MKVARTRDGNLHYCHLETLLSKDQVYFCPTCQQEVFLRTRRDGRQYFVHSSKKQTEDKHQGESHLHKEGKLALYKWFHSYFTNSQMEFYIKEEQQRPDILVTVAQQMVAVEYQCSPISLETMKKRNLGYENTDTSVFWFFGPQYMQVDRLNEILEYNLLYVESLGNFLLFFNDEQIELRHHITIEEKSRKYSYQSLQVPLKTSSAKLLLELLLKSKKLVYKELNQAETANYWSQESMEQLRLSTQRENRVFLEQLYMSQVNLTDLPKDCWRLPKYSYALKTPAYIWRGLIYIRLLKVKKGKIISLAQAMRWIEKEIECGRLRKSAINQWELTMEQELLEFFNHLVQETRFLRLISTNQWIRL
ncbi:competence protein CoiA [Granulicatella seriolae]|uniref:Competence protein CoiA family protein n=1 Tax=Granulicatella seriolae TaxID=2967226 RepID=A0ABT1WKQ8_9LACT|nr:competence protein CoiA family protein [Granulicatella seriolae]